MRISDWSSDVCSSDLPQAAGVNAVRSILRRFAELLDQLTAHLFEEIARFDRAGGFILADQAERHGTGGKLLLPGEGRKSGVEGKSVSVRVDYGGRCVIKKKSRVYKHR